jgi:hypothetical protein
MAFRYRGERRSLIPHPLAGWGDGETYGAAMVPGPHHRDLRIIFSDGEGWEHVSVSLPSRCPYWDEMMFVKALFWDDEDAVMQLHPPKSEYVNEHPYCLHLWRPTDQVIPLPPSEFVGSKSRDDAKTPRIVLPGIRSHDADNP